jgi:3-hydroxyisobutyrate dehydrogenase
MDETPEVSSMAKPVGFVGLGNMGSVLAANLVVSGHAVVAHDVAGPGRLPEGAVFASDLTEVARLADVVVLSLPSGDVSEEVIRGIVATPGRSATHIVDTSTIGIGSAKSILGLLEDTGIDYIDAPVSGGVAGARARTLMVMYAGSVEGCTHVETILAGLSDHRRCVGEIPGMAQALKLLNNFLSATALAATSEAVSFGCSVGLDMATMLEVLNMSSGQSAATSDKFPKHVLTGQYAAGFSNSLMNKDLNLYLQAVEEHGAPSSISQIAGTVWARFSEAEPNADFTRIFPFVDGS